MGAIVVGVDGSPSSLEALRWALHEAGARQVKLQALQAWSRPVVTSPLGAVEPALDAEGLKALAASAQERVEAALAGSDAAGAGVEVEALAVEGPPAAVLLEASRDADLLVLGSRGLGGFAGLLLGSVGHQCAQHASCPVVIVRGGARHG